MVDVPAHIEPRALSLRAEIMAEIMKVENSSGVRVASTDLLIMTTVLLIGDSNVKGDAWQ